MRAFVVSLLLGIAACSEPGEPQCTTNQLLGDTFVAMGKEVTVRAGLSVSCFVPNVAIVDKPLRVVKEVEVEVLDPENRKVAAQASAPNRSGGNTIFEVTSDVTFLLDRPGAWTVVARFEPNVGRSQQLVRVLDVRADAGVRELPTTLPPDCVALALTASGRLACVLPGGTPDTQLAIGDQRLKGSDFAIDGDAVWVLAPRKLNGEGALERYAPDDAGTYVLTHSELLSGSAGASGSFAAGYGAAYLFTTFGISNDLDRITPNDAGGFGHAALSVGSNRSPLVVVPGPDRVMVLATNFSGGQQFVSYFPDAGAELASAGSAVQPVAYGDGLLWGLRNLGGTTAQLVGFEGTASGIATATATVQPTGFFSSIRMGPQVPVVRVPTGPGESRAVVPVFGGGDLALEAFDPGQGYGEIVSATRRHAFARSQDGTKVKVFDR